EADDPKFRASGHTFETFTVIQRDGVCHAICRDGVTRPLSQCNFDARTAVVFDEYISECAVGIDIFGIDNRSATKSAEFPWCNCSETTGAGGRAPETESAGGSVGRE